MKRCQVIFCLSELEEGERGLQNRTKSSGMSPSFDFNQDLWESPLVLRLSKDEDCYFLPFDKLRGNGGSLVEEY